MPHFLFIIPHYFSDFFLFPPPSTLTNPNSSHHLFLRKVADQYSRISSNTTSRPSHQSSKSMIYIQDEKPHLPDDDIIETLAKKRKDSSSFQPVDHANLPKKTKPEQQRLTTLKMTPLQSKFIVDTMGDIREKEMTMRNDDRRRRYAVASSGCPNGRSGARENWTSMFLDRLGRDPNVAQIVATSGGLVTYCTFYPFLFLVCLCRMIASLFLPRDESCLTPYPRC